MMSHKILFIGSGQMSEAIIRALIKNNVYRADNILIDDISPQRLTDLKAQYQVTINNDVTQADIIVLGVRPQDDWAGVLKRLQSLKPTAIIISIIAGVTIAQIKAVLTVKNPVVRTIPNTLTDTGFGYSGVAVDDTDKEIANHKNVTDFFNGFGRFELIKESLLDIFTGFGVSGPNYVYFFYEALVDAGVLAGLPRDVAKRLALENLKGSAAMLEISKKHPRELLDINNSPAGVGMHGLYELNKSDFAAGLQRSVLAAVKRTTELGKV